MQLYQSNFVSPFIAIAISSTPKYVFWSTADNDLKGGEGGDEGGGGGWG
jgi:hypothetical protein